MDGIFRRYWHYDEVSIAKDSVHPARFHLDSPWIKFHIDVAPTHVARAEALGNKFAAEAISPADFDDINWFFSSLTKFPLAYILPRGEGFGTDQHALVAARLDLSSPRNALGTLCPLSAPLKRFAAEKLAAGWTWEIEAAIEFSGGPALIDPESLFSVARRFHLLNDLENNRSAELYSYINGLAGDPEKFRAASALVLRQNHYVTVQCDSVLRAALPIAQSAAAAVEDFILDEAGHDKILAKALRSLGQNPEAVPLNDTVVTLMEVFREAGRRNLLAFAMIVDIFERSSYRGEAPMATVMRAGGEAEAARLVDGHRAINDEGGHENVALGFLRAMAPVSQGYAEEALRLAELATLVIHCLSAESLEILRRSDRELSSRT